MLQTSPIFIPGGYVEDLASPADKENYNDNTLKSALASGQGAGEKKKVTLGLAIAGVSPQQSTVSAFEPTSTDYGTSKLKRKSKRMTLLLARKCRLLISKSRRFLNFSDVLISKPNF